MLDSTIPLLVLVSSVPFWIWFAIKRTAMPSMGKSYLICLPIALFFIVSGGLAKPINWLTICAGVDLMFYGMVGMVFPVSTDVKR